MGLLGHAATFLDSTETIVQLAEVGQAGQDHLDLNRLTGNVPWRWGESEALSFAILKA